MVPLLMTLKLNMTLNAILDNANFSMAVSEYNDLSKSEHLYGATVAA